MQSPLWSSLRTFLERSKSRMGFSLVISTHRRTWSSWPWTRYHTLSIVLAGSCRINGLKLEWSTWPSIGWTMTDNSCLMTSIRSQWRSITSSTKQLTISMESWCTLLGAKVELAALWPSISWWNSIGLCLKLLSSSIAGDPTLKSGPLSSSNYRHGSKEG